MARVAVPLLAAVLLWTGCAQITYEAAFIDQAVALNRIAPAGSFDRVGSLAVERRAVFLLSDLITVRDAELETEVLRALARSRGDAVINLRVEEKNDPVDILIQAVQVVLNAGQVAATVSEDEEDEDARSVRVGIGAGIFIGGGSLLGTRSLRITGDIIRWREGPAGEEARLRLSRWCSHPAQPHATRRGFALAMCLEAAHARDDRAPVDPAAVSAPPSAADAGLKPAIPSAFRVP